MAHHNYLIGHNTSPDRNKTNPSRLTALTPQNQPERPLLRGNQSWARQLVHTGSLARAQEGLAGLGVLTRSRSTPVPNGPTLSGRRLWGTSLSSNPP